MSQQKPRQALMSLVRENAGCFAGALTATVLIVLIDYLPPLLLAETVDSVLGANPSSLPGWMLSPLRGLGLSRDWLRANLWALGLTLVLIYLCSGVCNYLKGRLSAVASENIAMSLRQRLYTLLQRLPFS